MKKCINMQFKSTAAFYNNLFLTESKAGEYWPGVVAVNRPSVARSIQKRPRVNIPWYESSKYKKFILWHSAQTWLLILPGFEIKTTQLMTLSVITVRVIKSQPFTNQSEHLDLPKANLAIKYTFQATIRFEQLSKVC